MSFKDFLKSKTIWGVLLFAASRIVVDRSPASWAENIALVVTTIGARNALHQAGAANVPALAPKQTADSAGPTNASASIAPRRPTIPAPRVR